MSEFIKKHPKIALIIVMVFFICVLILTYLFTKKMNWEDEIKNRNIEIINEYTGYSQKYQVKTEEDILYDILDQLGIIRTVNDSDGATAYEIDGFIPDSEKNQMWMVYTNGRLTTTDIKLIAVTDLNTYTLKLTNFYVFD